MTTAIVTMQDIEKMAIAVAKSGLFGVKRPEEAMALMLVAQAEGRHPALAARDYDIIQGRPAKKTEAMLRDFLESGGKVEWHQLDDTIADATFSHPSGGTVRIGWDMKRAGAAGLASRDMWRKYPRQMLRSRCVSEGIRTVCPMATSGMYVPEEVRDFVPEKDITPTTPTSGAAERLTSDQLEQVHEVVEKAVNWLAQDNVAEAAIDVFESGLDADQMVYLWTRFNAKDGKAIKAAKDRRKARAALPPPKPGQISDAKRRRLEAVISERGVSRDAVKAHVKEAYGIEHFSELSNEQYAQLDDWLTHQNAAPPPASPPVESEAGTSSGQSADGAAPFSEQIKAAQTMDELQAVWRQIPKDDRELYIDVKDARKARLQASA